MKKYCSGCKQSKALEEFARHHAHEDGLQHHCKQCNAKTREARRDETRAYFRQYRIDNRERLSAFEKTAERKEQKRRNRVSPRGRVLNVLRAAKSRAKACGLDFSLAVDDIQFPTHCPVLGFPFDDKWGDRYPTLDRIEGKKGYVKGNVVIISSRANRIKSDASLEELRRLVKFYSSKSSM